MWPDPTSCSIENVIVLTGWLQITPRTSRSPMAFYQLFVVINSPVFRANSAEVYQLLQQHGVGDLVWADGAIHISPLLKL